MDNLFNETIQLEEIEARIIEETEALIDVGTEQSLNRVVSDTQFGASYETAMKLHLSIMSSAQAAASNLIDMCGNLKKMRDQKLYKALGHETFEQYCENRAGIKIRQAYTYINTYERLGSDFLKSNATLGITKLSILGKLSTADAEEIINDNPGIDAMSTKEIEQLVEENRKLTEQLTFFQNQEKDEAHSEIDNSKTKELENRIKELEVLLEKTKSEQFAPEPVPTIDETAIKEEIREQLKKEQDKAKKKLKSEYDKELKEAVLRTKKELKQQYSKKIESYEAIITEEKAGREKLEKELQLSDSNSAKFSIYFNSLQENFNQMMNILFSIPDDSTKEKYEAAIRAVLDRMNASINKG